AGFSFAVGCRTCREGGLVASADLGDFSSGRPPDLFRRSLRGPRAARRRLVSRNPRLGPIKKDSSAALWPGGFPSKGQPIRQWKNGASHAGAWIARAF